MARASRDGRGVGIFIVFSGGSGRRGRRGSSTRGSSAPRRPPRQRRSSASDPPARCRRTPGACAAWLSPRQTESMTSSASASRRSSAQQSTCISAAASALGRAGWLGWSARSRVSAAGVAAAVMSAAGAAGPSRRRASACSAWPGSGSRSRRKEARTTSQSASASGLRPASANACIRRRWAPSCQGSIRAWARATAMARPERRVARAWPCSRSRRATTWAWISSRRPSSQHLAVVVVEQRQLRVVRRLGQPVQVQRVAGQQAQPGRVAGGEQALVAQHAAQQVQGMPQVVAGRAAVLVGPHQVGQAFSRLPCGFEHQQEKQRLRTRIRQAQRLPTQQAVAAPEQAQREGQQRWIVLAVTGQIGRRRHGSGRTARTGGRRGF